MPVKRAIYEIAEFKAATDRPGEFTALVSVFGNVDKQGDRVAHGAFTKSLARWNASGDPIPVIWSHAWDDPFAHIGYVTSASETSTGLQITGKNDINKPFAAQVHDLLTSRRVKGMSFAYEVVNEHTAKDGANELTELNLIEAGPTLVGANGDARLLEAKSLLEDAAAKEVNADESATNNGIVISGNTTTTSTLGGITFTETKSGRRLSQATQTEMQSIHDDLTALQERMRTLMGTAADEPKSADTESGADPDVDAEDREPPAKSDRDNDEKQSDDDREPPAKSTDDELLLIKTRIEQARASTRRSP